jgi:hypothetical protein
MALEIYANTGESDIELSDSGAEFTLIDPDNDFIIFSGGSDVVDDGESIPSQSDLIQGGIIRDPADPVIVDRYFLADISADEIKEIHLMGNQNTRYVLAFSFDGETASEPVLEAYDDNTLLTVDSVVLGSGTPTNSMFRAKQTTSALPGANWVTDGGTVRLAGSSDGHFVLLNNNDGALVEAGVLYANLALIIPVTQTTGFSSNPVLCVKWLEN